MKFKNENIIDETIELNYSIIQLYRSSFIYIVPFIVIASCIELFFTHHYENAVLLIAVLSSFLFFLFFGSNRIVRRHQVCFHQIFVLLALSVSIYFFIQLPNLKELVYLLFVGMICSYLWLEFKTTLSYFIAFHVFLFFLSQYYSVLKIEYVIYVFCFSFGSLLVSQWLNKLINNSQSLQLSERKYRNLFEKGSNAILLLKKVEDNFIILDANTVCSDIFGYKDYLIIEKKFNDLSADTKEIKANHCKQISELTSSQQLELTCSFYRKDGSIFTTTARFSMIEMENERIVQVIVEDISEQLKNEIQLSEMVQSFKNIVENSPSIMFIFTDHKLVYKNSEAEEVYSNYLNSKTNHLFDLFPLKYKFLIKEIIQEVGEKTTNYTEITLGDPAHEKRYTMSAVSVNYKAENSILLILTDITLQNEYNIQRIRAEIAEETNKKLSEEIRRHQETQHDLIENTSKLNALFESSSNLFVLTIDRDLQISSFNSSFADIMKDYLDVNVVLGIDFLKTFPISETAFGNLIKKFKKAFRGESVELISHVPTLKGEIWIESFISPVKVVGEPIKEIAFIAHNITEKVENENRIADSEANNRATVSAIPDLLFKVNKQGSFTYARLNQEGEELLDTFAHTKVLEGKHILDVFKHQKQGKLFLYNIRKALRTGRVHTQNFIIPFIIGKTVKKMVYENRYSRVNGNEVIVISRDVTDKVEFETRLIESVKEKEVLLKEVHHRVKNNLQVISSILNLQSSYVEDEKTLEIINESQNRIRSMSYIHESLYQTKDFSSIDFHDYITNLIQNLVHSYQLFSGKTKLNLDIERIHLVLDQAIPCGLILNELVSNSLKYAYPEEDGGEIQIEIKEVNNRITIRVEDFGAGLPEGFKIEESESLGLGLVDALVDQIDGELILKTDSGTKYLIIFDKQEL